MKIMSKFTAWSNYFKSVFKEVPHLKLPTRAETIAYLIIVLLMALVTSIIFFLVDMTSYKFVTKILMFFS